MRNLIACLAMIMAAQGFAQISFDGVNLTPNNRTDVGGGLTLSEIEYEANNEDFDVERTILHGAFGQNFGAVDGFGYFGLIVDGEVKDGGSDFDDGKGFLLGGGVRGRAHSTRDFDINWLTSLTYNREKYEKSSTKVELSGLELQVAGIFQFLVQQNFAVYGGVHLFPFTDGKFEVKTRGNNHSEDYERDSILGLSAGANFYIGNGFLRPEIRLIGQQSLSFNAGMTL